MPEPSHSFELSTAEPWHGVRPGMSRAEATRILQAAGAEISTSDDAPGWMMADGEDWGLELRFSEDGEQPVRQLGLDNWNFVWRGQTIANQPLHEVLAILGDAAPDAAWRPEDAVASPFDDLEPLDPKPPTDEDLLDDGTLWLPKLGLGLVLCAGKVNEIVWRRPDDVPKHFAGPITDAQKKLSAEPDVEAKIRKHWSTSSLTSTTPFNPLQRIITLLHLVALVYIGWLGLQDTQRWHTAATLTGKLVNYEKATGKPWVDHYTIEYQDPSGHPQTARLESGEFYIQPKEIGEETEICYLAGNPPRVKGPARVRDAAFIDYMPWAIGVGASYLVLWTLAGFVWRLKRTAAAAPSSPPPSSPNPFTPDRGR